MLIAWPGPAGAQDPEVPPDPEPPAPVVVTGEGAGLVVNRVLVPRKLDAILSRGIEVNATCIAACRLTVRIGLSAGVAAKLGLRKRRLGANSVDAEASQPQSVRVRFSRAAREAFENYTGGGRFLIRVSSSP
jgi:hypothetical protein